MLPELILKEEYEADLKGLTVLSALSGILGIYVAYSFFSDNQAVLAPLIAAVPLVYPLMDYYFKKEEDLDFKAETEVYGAMFLGLVAAFFLSGIAFPDFFDTQLQTTGLTGEATASEPTFTGVFTHNITLFGTIILVSAILGSAGAFILALNASMVGVFFSQIALDSPMLAIAYIPHTALEMSGFIVAGILGTTVSASVYREHFEMQHWLNLCHLLFLGFAAITLGAFIETV